MMIKIAPSILSSDFSRLGEEVRMLEMAGADMIHIDVMDGHFVPNLTIGPMVVSAIRGKTHLPFDVHLMMDNPMDFVDAYIEAGANSVTLHAEVLPHLHRAIQHVKKKGVKVAVALNPSTPLDVLDYVLEDLDMVLIMTVNPGYGGQRFIPVMLKKIERLRRCVQELGIELEIQVDGGININNIRRIVRAGANVIVAGSAVFTAPDPAEMIRALRKEAEV